jgi:hypothetical protein
MGYTRYNPDTWSRYARATAGKTHLDYGRTSLLPAFDPTRFKLRESRNSAQNPKATPIMVGLDVTGSMGMIVEAARKGLGTLLGEIIDRQPVTDPHVMALAIGDFTCDRAPIQATQFESDAVVIGRQVEDLWLERGGGGNDFEGYLGPLYLAALRTDTDAAREGRKGFLFTVGDEEPQRVLRAADVQRFFGDGIQRDLAAEELLGMVERDWHYFHLMTSEGAHMRRCGPVVTRAWTDLIGQHALLLTDHTRMAEVIISTIEVISGKDNDAVARSWSGSTSLVVRDAIGHLAAASDSAPFRSGPQLL